MSHGKKTGKCEGCGVTPRILRQIESGQWVCQTCLREIHGPKGSPKLALLTHIKYLREQGFDVSDDLTKEEAELLDWVISVRSCGIDVAGDTPLKVLQRLSEAHSEGIREALYLPRPVDDVDLWHGLVDVAGITYPNPNGTSRIDIVRRCVIGEQVKLIPQPSNPVDPDAVMVCRQTGEQMGYLPRQCAADIAEDRRFGHQYWAFVDLIRDAGVCMDLALGTSSTIYAVKLLMIVAQANVVPQRITEYIRDVWKARHGSTM